MLVDLLKQRNC